MPGESISGYINVKTFKPSEIEGFSTMVEVGRGEQDLGGGDIERTNARVSYSDDIFGILVYASKNLREQITQNRETEYGVAGPGLLTPDKIDFRNFPVREFLFLIIFSGFPSKTSFPPSSPGPGPISIIQSAFLITSR